MLDLRDSFDRRPLRFLAVISVLVTGVVAALLERFGGWNYLSPFLHGNRSQIYGALVSLFGTLAGFVLTCLIFVAGFLEKPMMGTFNRSGHGRKLMGTFHKVLIILGTATSVAFVCLIFDRDCENRCDVPGFWRLAFYPLFYSGLLSVCGLGLLSWFIKNLIDFQVSEQATTATTPTGAP